MMRGSVLALLFIASFICGIHAQIGFKTTLSSNGINYLKDVGMEILEGQLSSIAIPDITGDASIGSVSYSLTSIVLSSVTIPSSDVTLVPSTSLELAISGAQATMTMNWYYREDGWPHVSDSGSASVAISDTSISVTIEISEANGRPVATTTACSVSIGSLSITLSGGASWLYNWFIGQFSGPITTAAQNALQGQIPTAINQGLASAFNSLPLVEPINHNIEINYEMEAAPYVTTTYFTLSALGEFFSVQNPQNAPFTPGTLPDIATDQMVQMFVSDFTANSASFVFFSENMLQYTVTDSMLPANAPLRLNSTYFTELIPAFEKAYPNQMFDLFLYALDTPVATFAADGAQVMINGAIDIVMIPNKTVAFTLGVKVLTTGTAQLSGTNITANLAFVNATLSLLNSTCGDFDVSTLQDIVSSLVIAILPSANKILGAGFPVPSITGLSFQNPTIGWGEGYMYLSTDATYQPPALKEAIKTTKHTTVAVIN